MKLTERIDAFIKLGKFLGLFSKENLLVEELNNCDKLWFENLTDKIHSAIHHNGWFTDENVYFAIQTWAETLTEENLQKWVSQYDFTTVSSKRIGIITAGNIPLVGFHDFISVLMSGHEVLVKQSSNDQQLLPVLAEFLICINPEFKSKITFIEGRLQDFDAVIATGSNNTARYFEHYFGKYPNIIRMSRNGVAVLSGDESIAELEALGDDIFKYFGLGCRSVSKLFVPRDYDFDKLFKALYEQRYILEYRKYENNYHYNKTVYLMSQFKLIENGFLVLKEDFSYASPIATLNYEYYDSLSILKQRLLVDTNKIQCVVGKLDEESIPFGRTQKPMLWEYADGVDTIEFLLSI